MNLPKIIYAILPEYNNNAILLSTVYPYVVGKVMKFADDDLAALDYAAKQVNYVKSRIKGYNIFIVHDGFLHNPKYHVPDNDILLAIGEMKEWYRENILNTMQERKSKKYIQQLF